MHRGRVADGVGVALGGAVLIAAGVLARGGARRGEVGIFRRANTLPDEAFPAVWIPMQYGTFGTIPALAVLGLVRRRPRLAAAIAAGGTAAWTLAKAVKPLVRRPRPATILEGARQRRSERDDLGFPSGHAAVSAALTLVAWPHIGAGWRIASAALAGFVPFARLYVGAHLPLDVLGGSALGAAVASSVD